MEDDIVRYDKTHESLTKQLAIGIEKLKELNLATPGVEFTLQKLAAAGQKAEDIAIDRQTRESALLLAALTEIKERWAPVINGFAVLVGTAKSKAAEVLARIRKEQDEKRTKAEAELEKARAAERANPGPTALRDLRTAKKAVEALPPKGAPVGVKTETGSLFGRQNWTWEVEDVKLVPKEYTLVYVDPPKVDLAVANGVRQIAGIRIYQKETMVSKPRR